MLAEDENKLFVLTGRTLLAVVALSGFFLLPEVAPSLHFIPGTCMGHHTGCATETPHGATCILWVDVTGTLQKPLYTHLQVAFNTSCWSNGVDQLYVNAPYHKSVWLALLCCTLLVFGVVCTFWVYCKLPATERELARSLFRRSDTHKYLICYLLATFVITGIVYNKRAVVGTCTRYEPTANDMYVMYGPTSYQRSAVGGYAPTFPTTCWLIDDLVYFIQPTLLLTFCAASMAVTITASLLWAIAQCYYRRVKAA